MPRSRACSSRANRPCQASRPARWWNPLPYQWTSWALRVIGFTLLGLRLLGEPTPGFATFLVVKGLLAVLAFSEVLAIVLPLAATVASKFFAGLGHEPSATSEVIQFLNRLNLTATLGVAVLAVHQVLTRSRPFRPEGSGECCKPCCFTSSSRRVFLGGRLSVPGDPFALVHGHLSGSVNWKLFLGGLLFWNTMYLLRYGLFVLFTGLASVLATFPIKGTVGLLACAYWPMR